MSKFYIVNKSVVFFLLLMVCWGCSQHTGTEKHQGNRDQVIRVQDRIVEIDTDEILIGRNSWFSLLNDYLLIGDYDAYDQLIHILDKNNFRYMKSTGDKGQGPGEIARLGTIAADETHGKFYVTDHGKNRIYAFDLDSVLRDTYYMPWEKMRMTERMFPVDYRYINDTLSIGLIIEPTGSYGFVQSLGKWNLLTGEAVKMKYVHPEIEKKRIHFAFSLEKDIYVECYSYHDLFTICGLDEELKWNVYGRKWNNRKSNEHSYFGDVEICGDKIVAMWYDGIETFYTDKNGEVRGRYPKQFIVFDLNGEYLKTLDVGYSIVRFCYDPANHRLIMNMDDEIQFGYLDMEGVI